jgi:SAM-dependent methyltransferase
LPVKNGRRAADRQKEPRPSARANLARGATGGEEREGMRLEASVPSRLSSTVLPFESGGRGAGEHGTVALLCPECSAPLERHRGRTFCSECDRLFARHGEVLDLAIRAPAESPLPRPTLDALLADAERIGWRRSIERHLQPVLGDRGVRLAEDERRADFACLLPRRHDSTILEIGAGLGAVTAGLARVFHVVCADWSLEMLRFVAIRLAQEGLHALTLIRLDPLGAGRLPFAEAQFDAVVVNGVLERVSEANPALPAAEVQEATLGEIHRCLRPGGTLYLGIENRFRIGGLLRPSQPGGLRFASLAPRRFAQAIPRRLGRSAPGAYTRSLGGYQRLLRRAGFENVQLFLPKPSYRQPDYILPPSREAIAYYFETRSPLVGTTRALARLVAALGLYPYLADSFAWVAETSA